MSSDRSEIGAWSPRSSAERILMQLKMHGALTAAALGQRLAITGEAARQQLVRLAADGLVAAETVPSGVGRPSRAWSLTPRGQACFPDTHAALTVQILAIVGETLGEAALDRIIAAREEETRRTYVASLSACEGVPARAAALAELRSAEGYMAETHADDDGSVLLVENHCPICAAATACQGFCRAELQVFRSVLGPSVDVAREEHIVGGGRRCTYRIREVAT